MGKTSPAPRKRPPFHLSSFRSSEKAGRTTGGHLYHTTLLPASAGKNESQAGRAPVLRPERRGFLHSAEASASTAHLPALQPPRDKISSVSVLGMERTLDPTSLYETLGPPRRGFLPGTNLALFTSLRRQPLPHFSPRSPWPCPPHRGCTDLA